MLLAVPAALGVVGADGKREAVMNQKKYLAHLSALALTMTPLALSAPAPAAAQQAQVSPQKTDLLGKLLRPHGDAGLALVGFWKERINFCEADWAERCGGGGGQNETETFPTA